MDSQAILTKAIEKVIAGGWHEAHDFTVRDGHIYDLDNQRADDLIFNHVFAKALWPKGHCDKQELLNFDDGSRHVEHHLYHLQMMVIAPDPIKYLGENLDN